MFISSEYGFKFSGHLTLLQMVLEKKQNIHVYNNTI